MFGSSSSYSSIPKQGISGASTVSFNNVTSKYTINFDGKAIETTVTDISTIVDRWVKEIIILYAGKSFVVVGLDVKWRPKFSRYKNNKAATLQLCVDDKCLILQLFHILKLPRSLKNFLMNPTFTFVGDEVADDISKIKNEYGLNCGSHADIRKLLISKKWPLCYGMSWLGLKKLASGLYGLNMLRPLHIYESDWRSRFLSIEQVEYACIDAYAYYKIGHKLLKNGRS
ncbi:3'-5' exonuclease-like [Arachis duranensis]|uniref:3'-5' exonuclease-like n=1 Tax=Arachis duranensis TaxID=130453 RepID=A0A6P4CNL5_ARADU|nr:3'-5' exonuclease-like [Arachis duranensis]